MQTVILGSPINEVDFYNVVVNRYQVQLSDEAKQRIMTCRDVVDKLIEDKKVVYGITTGFGSLSTKAVDHNDLDLLQENLIKSHAIGTGEPVKAEIVRGMLLLRLTCIAHGVSGVSIETAETLVDALNKNFISRVPCQGTVGASGDLAPLSHMVLGLMGEGKALWNGKYIDAAQVLKSLKITPLKLRAKEGLALNNGTQFMTSHMALALYNAKRLIKLSNLIAAMTIEALHGVHHAFDPRIHELKPHKGQIAVAKEILSYLTPLSDINKKHTKGRVQDAYSLRCIPQVHGSALDIINFVEEHILIEMNSVNDNPLIIDGEAISGGNFHGMSIASCGDMLALAMSYLCNISERRLDRLLSSHSNGFLPSLLSNNLGLNSGLMIVQYASAGITAETRHLAAPASVHTIPTCEGVEDVVSMGGWSARKALTTIDNTYKVLAYELLAACRALDFTEEQTTPQLLEVCNKVRAMLPEMQQDSYIAEEYETIVEYLKHMDI